MTTTVFTNSDAPGDDDESLHSPGAPVQNPGNDEGLFATAREEK
jgi:hypothetical protein